MTGKCIEIVGCRPERQIKQLEENIFGIVEESILAENKGDLRLALDKAKEALHKEKSVLRQREQSALRDTNSDLSFLVNPLQLIITRPIFFLLYFDKKSIFVKTVRF